MQRRPRVMPAYEPAQIEPIMDIIRRIRTDEQIDRGIVEESLLEVIQAIGLASDGTESSLLWQELSLEDEDFHRTARDGFRELAEAEDPFELAKSDRKYPGLLSRSAALRRIARQREATSNSQAPIWQAFWGNLSAEEQSEVCKSLEALARFHESFIRRGCVQKTKLDTALLELADLYLRWTGQTIARHRLPYSVESRFIQFAVAALEPVGQYFEVSAAALSKRWERIVLPDRKEERELNESLLASDPEG